MENILIGHAVAEQVFILNAQLRSSTHTAVKQAGIQNLSAYSPWTSIAPLTGTFPPNELLQCPNFERGSLVADAPYLAHVKDFIANKANAIIAGLPSSPDDWLPDGVVSNDLAALFREGKRILVASSPVLSRLYLEFVDFVVPLAHGRNRGYSTHLARGVIFRSFPPQANAYDVAIDLAHELGHQVLMAWQSVDKILATDHDQPVFSEIRQVDRPAIQSFHAAVALAYMLFFVKTMQNSPECQDAGLRRGKTYRGTLQASLNMATHSLRKNCQFTPLGLKMMEEMELVGA